MTTATPDQFAAWLKTAVPGSRFLYYVGHLFWDRTKFEYTTRKTGQRDVREIKQACDGVATAAWQAHEAGKVHLVQSRVLPTVVDPETNQVRSRGAFAYFAVKRPRVLSRTGRLAAEVQERGMATLGADNAFIEP